LSGTLAFVMQI